MDGANHQREDEALHRPSSGSLVLQNYTVTIIMVWIEPIRSRVVYAWDNISEQPYHMQSNAYLVPDWQYLPSFKSANIQFKKKQKQYLDNRHGMRVQSEIYPMDQRSSSPLRIPRYAVEGRVVQPAETPRSYIVETPSGDVRRNRNQLNIIPAHACV